MPTYTRPHKRKLRKESRTLPIYGKGDDAGRYFHCWNCGFVCDVRRDELGDAESTAGDDHLDVYGIAQENPYTENPGKYATLNGDTGHFHVALEIGADSNPKSVRHDFKSDVTKGCPFCGSTNWRGDF